MEKLTYAVKGKLKDFYNIWTPFYTTVTKRTWQRGRLIYNIQRFRIGYLHFIIIVVLYLQLNC